MKDQRVVESTHQKIFSKHSAKFYSSEDKKNYENAVKKTVQSYGQELPGMKRQSLNAEKPDAAWLAKYKKKTEPQAAEPQPSDTAAISTSGGAASSSAAVVVGTGGGGAASSSAAGASSAPGSGTDLPSKPTSMKRKSTAGTTENSPAAKRAKGKATPKGDQDLIVLSDSEE